MKTTFKEEDKNFVMYFEGRLDTAASSEVEQSMAPLYDCSGHDIILDCTALEYISSSGLRSCSKLMQEKDSPILGLHLEGHYLNPTKAGAQLPEWIKNPDPNEYIPIVEHSDCLTR